MKGHGMKTKFRFTRTALEAVVCPAGKCKVRVRDSEVPALSFVALATGGKGYRLYKKIHGRPVEVRSGTVGQPGHWREGRSPPCPSALPRAASPCRGMPKAQD